MSIGEIISETEHFIYLTFGVQPGRDPVELRLVSSDNTLLGEIGHRRSVSRFFITPGNGNLMVLHGRVFHEQQFLPVGIILRNLIQIKYFRFPFIPQTFIHDHHVLLSIQHINFSCHVLEAGVTGVGNVHFTCFSTFGSYKYNSVGGPGSVNGCRSSVFQHINGFDIARVQVIYSANSNTVNDV